MKELEPEPSDLCIEEDIYVRTRWDGSASGGETKKMGTFFSPGLFPFLPVCSNCQSQSSQVSQGQMRVVKYITYNTHIHTCTAGGESAVVILFRPCLPDVYPR